MCGKMLEESLFVIANRGKEPSKSIRLMSEKLQQTNIIEYYLTVNYS